MAYMTGSANTLADLLTAIQTACTANGWTLAGSVLTKGTCYAKLQVSGSAITVQGGTGIDGGNNLTGVAPNPAYLRQIGAMPLAYPMTYFIHVLTAPDEVYIVVNYSVSYYQYIAFGQSPVAGLPGTGNWFGAPYCDAASTRAFSTNSAGAIFFGAKTAVGLFLANTFYNPAPQNAYVHHNLDAAGWSGVADAGESIGTLLDRQPNAWNGETALLPIQPALNRGSSKVSLLLDLAHARYLRNDNLAPQSIITLGSDRWRVYPWYALNATNRNGGFDVAHSGTLGFAVRYDGP